jgi:uncharacterized membrane protein
MSAATARGAGPGGRAATTSIDAQIARLLTLGTRAGIGLLAAGSLLLVVNGISPLETTWPPLDVAALPSQLIALQPAAFLWLGLIVTIATPLMRVAAATLGFARAGERRMVALGVAVLVVIALAVVAGVAGG